MFGSRIWNRLHRFSSRFIVLFCPSLIQDNQKWVPIPGIMLLNVTSNGFPTLPARLCSVSLHSPFCCRGKECGDVTRAVTSSLSPLWPHLGSGSPLYWSRRLGRLGGGMLRSLCHHSNFKPEITNSDTWISFNKSSMNLCRKLENDRCNMSVNHADNRQTQFDGFRPKH